MSNKYFKFFCIIIQKEGQFYPIQIEYYNMFTCYLFDTGLFSIFKTFKEANKYKNVILEWKRLGKLSGGFNHFGYITIAEIKQAEYFRKPTVYDLQTKSLQFKKPLQKIKNELANYNQIHK